jgi:uncharacterized protein
MTPQLSKIWIFPIKSLDGVEVEEATILPSGALAHDREFAIADLNGKIVNGKRNAQIHRLRSRFDLAQRQVCIRIEGQTATETFDLDRDRTQFEQWLSEFFQFPVQLIQNLETGYPDDLASPGPTLVSLATLEAVQTWFRGSLKRSD